MKTRGVMIDEERQRKFEEIEDILNVEITLTEDDPIIKSLDDNPDTEIMAKKLLMKVLEDFYFEYVMNGDSHGSSNL